MMLVLFFPIGLYTMWKYTNWKKSVKVLISIFIGMLIFISIVTGDYEDPTLETKPTYTMNEDENSEEKEAAAREVQESSEKQNPKSTTETPTRAPTTQVESQSDVPDGVTAVCKDGTYSYSKHHSGSCSHHGGVARFTQDN